jgi:hypothetical protein
MNSRVEYYRAWRAKRKAQLGNAGRPQKVTADNGADHHLFWLTDAQLAAVIAIAHEIRTPEKRSVFLERVSAMLTVRGQSDDAIVAEVAKLAATGLARRPAA